MALWTTFALSMVILYLKVFGVALVQGFVRIKHKQFAIPEDAAFFGNNEPREEHPMVLRAQRTLRNDGENIPLYLGLAIGYIHLECWLWSGVVYMSLFTLSRVLHSIAYLKSLQPMRNRMYILGSVACLAMSAHIVWQVALLMMK